MLNIVGLTGVIGSGKTFQRDKLVAEGYVAIDFKDELIDMCEDLCGFPIREDYEQFKQSIVGLTNPHNPAANTVEMTKKVEITFPNIMTGRRMLQRMGTEVMRKRDANYWVKAWAKKAILALQSGKSVVVADVRFENELRAIRMLQKPGQVEAKVMFCNYKSDRYDASSKHPSEALAQDLLDAGFRDGDLVPEGFETPGI
jgi:hypothetical protein